MEIVTEAPIIPEELCSKLKSDESGSLLFHFAVVKSLADDTAEQTSTGIRFQRAGDMESELAEISADIRGKFRVDDVLLARRIGTLQVSDIISLVAVSASRSNDAFEACQHGLKRLKKMTTVAKSELH